MKRFLFAICLSIISICLPAQQIRRVFFTLDVSGSMGGSKYVLANYTVQMIASLCDSEDEIYLYIGGDPIKLSAGQLKDIQYPIGHYSTKYPWFESEFNDIICFSENYSSSSKKQDWLFIIGDGEWFYDLKSDGKPELFAALEPQKQKFHDIVKENNLHVCFLQTGVSGREESDFFKFVDSIGSIDSRKTDSTVKSIREGCDYYARKILGFSDVPLKIESSGKTKIIVKCEIPLSACIVVYQDNVESQALPALQSAKAGDKKFVIKQKGTPTTKPLGDETLLSGQVWEIESAGAVSTSKNIELVFDKNVNTQKISVFPLIGDIDFSTGVLALSGDRLKRLDSNVFSICKNEKKVLVKIDLDEETRQIIPTSLLKRMSVIIQANNHSYSAKYKDGTFEAEIDLIDDETQYYAEIDCPGYFKHVTDKITIRKGECEDAKPVVKVNPMMDAGTITYDALNENGEIRVIISDAETREILDPQKFDVSAEIDEDFFYEPTSLRVDGEALVIKVKPKGDWCECLSPTDLNIKIVSRMLEGAFDDKGKRYDVMEQVFHLTVVKNPSWFSRCKWIVFMIAFLLLLLIYIWSLLKKHRFKKNARVISSYYDYYGSKKKGGERYLRDTGFGAWLKRWFSPVDERVHLFLNKPRVNSFKIVASESKEMVNIEKSALASKTMSLSGYNPDDSDQDKGKFVKWADGESIDVFKSGGGREGELVFISGEENDGALFRIFLSVLSVIDILAIVSLVILMLRAL